VDAEEAKLGRDDFDPESRKAVARHLAAMVREDSEGRLRDIASRSDDPEVRNAVSESRDEVARSSRRLVNDYKEGYPLQQREVKTTRAEAHAILEALKNPPTDES
jgi:hypothetical protein